jgi:hypothetical protein
MRRAAAPALLALALATGLAVPGIVGAAVADAAPARSPARAWSLRLAPAPGDFALVRLRLRARGRLVEHEVRLVENPFAQAALAAGPGLCDLATRGSAL